MLTDSECAHDGGYMSKCNVSVIIPVYQAEQHIDRCITSILNQTESNIELWLIDDGSPDQCGNICDAFAQSDERVHVLHKANAGVSAARNDGIKRASGKYIAFVDADDYIEPTMLSSLVAQAERNEADIVMCGYYIEHISVRKTANICCDIGEYSHAGVKQLFLKFFGRDYTGLASMWNKLYLRSFLNLHDIQVDESLERAEDFWFNFKAFECATRISVVSTPLYHYIQNEDSVMHSYRKTQFEDWTENRKRLLLYANEKEICLQHSEFYYNYVYNSVLLLRRLLEYSDFAKMNEIMRDPFLRGAIQQTFDLPPHIRLITQCIKRKFYHLAERILKIWLLYSGE